MSTHTLNTTDDRLDTATAWLRAHADTMAGLTAGERVVAAVGLLICDDDGHISRADMASALADSHTISVATLLLSVVDV